MAAAVAAGPAASSASGQSGWDRAVVEAKEHAFARLQEELKSAHQELLLRDEEVARLSRIREQVEAELEELTASLFQVNKEREKTINNFECKSPTVSRTVAIAKL